MIINSNFKGCLKPQPTPKLKSFKKISLPESALSINEFINQKNLSEGLLFGPCLRPQPTPDLKGFKVISLPSPSLCFGKLMNPDSLLVNMQNNKI